MIFPSDVNFTSSGDLDLSDWGLERSACGTKGEGSEDADVLAGVLRNPRGSFRVELDIRSTEPEQVESYISLACSTVCTLSGQPRSILLAMCRPQPSYPGPRL